MSGLAKLLCLACHLLVMVVIDKASCQEIKDSTELSLPIQATVDGLRARSVPEDKIRSLTLKTAVHLGKP